MSHSFLVQFTISGCILLMLLIGTKIILFFNQHAAVKSFRQLFHFSMIEIMDEDNKNQKAMRAQNVLTTLIIISALVYVGLLFLLH